MARGLSLIELLVVIAIVGIALAGIVVVYTQTVRASADPLVRKQALAVAESLLAEVMVQPFTYCDPQDAANDPNSPPTSTAGCSGGAAGSQDNNGGTLGPKPATETRFSTGDPFDNVADYHGYAMSSGIWALDGSGNVVLVSGLGAYSASVSVARAGAVFGLADDEVLQIDVLVSGAGQSITLTAYRFRHSPNASG